MKNSIRVSVTFSFKGQTYQPSMVLDLDQYMATGASRENLYSQLAKQNNIGHYSYEYEMLQSEPLCFDQAEGLAKEFLTGQDLDMEGLQHAWLKQSLKKQLTDIASQHMNINELDDIDGLEETLLAVYQSAGQQ
jgi:hypothetical protein